MNIDLTVIVQALLALIAAIITGFVLPYLKTKMSAANYEKLVTATAIAVEAAEQLYGAGFGKEKFDYAVKYLKSKGFTVDEAIIEAMVKELIHKDTTPSTELAINSEYKANADIVNHEV